MEAPSPLLKGQGCGWEGPSNNWVTWGVWNILLKRGDKPDKGGWCRNGRGGGGVPLFYYFTVQSHLLCVCGESKVPFITFWIFSLLSYLCKILIQVFIVLKPGIICTFLIHSGSLQKYWLLYLTKFEMYRKVNGQFFWAPRQGVS